MRVTGFWSLAGLVVAGVMLADLLIHPAGTNALGQATVNNQKVAYNALLGQVQ